MKRLIGRKQVFSCVTSQKKTTFRTSRGNMLALIVGIAATALIALLFFCFKMTRIMGGYAEQRTAIEAAALAVANDLDQMAYTDPASGQIFGLSDSAPTGTGPGVLAGDGFALPVIGINTLQATVRLDLALADMFDDRVWQLRAAEDYSRLVTIRTNLVAAAQAALISGTIMNANGVSVNIKQDAVNAYNQNPQRMTGASVVPITMATMSIQYGYIPAPAGGPPTSSDTPVPQGTPPNAGGSPTVVTPGNNQQQNGLYVANVNIPYQSKGPFPALNSFAFAAGGPTASLADPLAFQLGPPAGVAANMFIPSVVKVTATQTYNDRDEHGRAMVRVVKISGAAQMADLTDPRDCYIGMLAFSFPNGIPVELTSPGLMYNDAANPHLIDLSPSDEVKTPPAGDYPETALQPSEATMINWVPQSPLPGNKGPYWPYPPNGGNTMMAQHPRVPYPLSLALYDWVRNGGCTVNAQDLSSWFSGTSVGFGGFANNLPNSSFVYEFQFTPSPPNTVPMTSMIQTYFVPSPTTLSRRVSQKQWVSMAGAGLCTLGLAGPGGDKYYDIDIIDNVFTQGTTFGGDHAGMPIGNQIPVPPGFVGSGNTFSTGGGGNGGAAPPPVRSYNLPAPVGGEFPAPSGPGMRPTCALAVNVIFRETGFPFPTTDQMPGMAGQPYCGPPPGPSTPIPGLQP